MPNLEELGGIYLHLKHLVYRDLRVRQMEHERLFDATFDLNLDKDHFSSPFRRARARNLVMRPVNHIAMDRIKVSQQPLLRGPKGMEGKQARERADRVERWGQAILDDWAVQPPFFLRELITNLELAGEAYLRLDIDPACISEPEEYEGNPFILTVPDAMSVYASLDMDKRGVPYEVFQETVASARQVRLMLERWHAKGQPFIEHLKPTDLVYLVEYFSATERAFFAIEQGTRRDGAVTPVPLPGGDIVKNEWGFVPFVRGFSGRGKWPRDGNPARVAVGVLTGMESTIVNEARLDTMMLTHCAKHVAPLALFKTVVGVELTPKELQLGPGRAVQLSDDRITEFRFEMVPPLPPAMVQVKGSIEQTFEAFQPGVSSGVYQGGEAAISRSTRLNQASLEWEAQFISGKTMIANIMGLVLQSVGTVIEGSVEMRGFRLGAEEINGHYKVTVSIEPGNPEQQQFDYLLGKQMEGSLPLRKIVEDFYHEEDATQFAIDLVVDDLRRNDPVVRQAIVQEALKLLGIQPGGIGAGPGGGSQGQATGRMAQTMGEMVPGVGGSPTRGIPALPQQEAMVPGGGLLGRGRR